MVCSSDKTRLSIIGTKANRKSKLENDNIKIKIRVCGDTIEESQSEKLLGLIVNNTLNLKDHLYGNKENTGLLTKLSKTVGVLKKMRKLMPIKIFKQGVSSIFTSKLIYCLTVWGGIWNLPGNYQHKQMSITKEDLRKLQVLQNKIMRIESGYDYETPTEQLLQKCNQLSVHQQIAYHSICQLKKMIISEEPKYHIIRFTNNKEKNIERIDFHLSLARGFYF